MYRKYHLRQPLLAYNNGVTLDVDVVNCEYEWENSPRNGGKLQLRSNPHTRRWSKITVRQVLGPFPGRWNGQTQGDVVRVLGFDPRRNAYNEAYARLRSKLYKGGAALGVTLGSYRQSRNMVLERYKFLNRDADRVLGQLATATPRKTASLHLEVVFGWQPLLGDIVSAATTAAEYAFPPSYVKGRAKWYEGISQHKPRSLPRSGFRRVNGHASGVVTLSSCVRISNPNVWLAERLGLVNVASVAWDLVPWSFVVNMFASTGQIVNSFTDYLGLEFVDAALTYNDSYMIDVWEYCAPSYWYPVATSESFTEVRRDKTRTLVTKPPTPHLTFKIPNASWGTAAIAASLLTQKVSRMSRYFT